MIMAAEKIFLVEDIDDIRVPLQLVLERAGYVVEGAADGSEALRKVYSFQPDLVLLDIMIPGMDGFMVCQRIRDISEVPIIMLTALGDEAEKVRSLELGADDYVVKGTGMDELLARIKAVLRRAQMPPVATPDDKYSDAVLKIDFGRQQVEVRGERVELTRKEYGLFVTLVQRDGAPVSTQELLRAVWDAGYDPELVKWHVARLRRKIETNPSKPELVITRRGYGYAYNVPGR